MIGLGFVYALAGLLFAVIAGLSLRDRGNPRRYATALFWGLLALAFLAGDALPPLAMGALVLSLAALAGLGGVRLGSYPERGRAEKREAAARLGHGLFRPALAIPLLTVLGSLGLKHLSLFGTPVLAPEHATVTSLGLACALAFAYALRLTGERPLPALQAARRMMDAIGWAALLPLLLATLGGVFARAGVGDSVAALVSEHLVLDQRLAAVLAYALGMALFTVIMGNAFAAFPVLTAGIALPILVGRLGAEPAPVAAIGMLSGYCGTLLTPMAANFNVVPAALLELKDKHAVIRAQIATALPLLACNVLLMYWLAFP